MSMKPVLAILALTTASVSVPVLAADSNFYGVLSIGRSTLDTDAGAVNNFNVINGFSSSLTSSSSDATSGKAQLGYMLGKTFALEGGYTYLGKVNFNSTLGTPTGRALVQGSKEASLVNLDLVAKYVLNEQFSILGRIGGYYWQTKSDMPSNLSSNGNFGTMTVNDTGFDFKIGAGVQYDFTPKFAMRGEFERFNGVGKNETSGDSKVNQLTVGAVLKF